VFRVDRAWCTLSTYHHEGGEDRYERILLWSHVERGECNTFLGSCDLLLRVDEAYIVRRAMMMV
jgi:predicted transposase YdaD